ncbi:MAG TPA: flagellar type III secretion system pore protein FliP [Kofleriaceae bacterium]|nr:flagellar type III secretion system pore protein FliP [Kofleriaceae bacterium]
MTLEGVAVIAAVAIVPVVALMLSAFVKTSVVLALLRNALGAPQAPPGIVVTGLALLVTVFVMAPVGEQVLDAVAPVTATAPARLRGALPPGPGRAVVPPTPGDTMPATGSAPGTAAQSGGGAAATGGTAADVPTGAAGGGAGSDPLAGRELPHDLAGWTVAAERAEGPVRAFLVRHAHAGDRAAFVALARQLRGPDVAEDDLLVLSAAFVTSELTEAFAIAFLVFLPFLVLDLVVGIGLSSAGLTTVSPAAVSLPLKLLLFVAVDGWRLLVEGLIRGYA